MKNIPYGAFSPQKEYIFPLDNDDMFLDKDVLEIITKIANKGNFDIVEFKGIETNKVEINDKVGNINHSDHPLNLIMIQPNLSQFPIQPGDKFGEIIFNGVFLWEKCIKTKLYQNA